MEPVGILLDPTLRSAEAMAFEDQLQHRLVGQPAAVTKAAQLVQTFLAGFNAQDRPAGVMLMLGPTGTGKTKLVETVAELLFGSPKAFFKLACAEYQDSYQTNRLLGAPPGYVGYAEHKGDGLLSQEKLDKHQTADLKLNLVLFDEIEKAHDRLFDVMLNILDKGEITTSNGQTIDFTRSLIFMTSNLGAAQIGKAIGFGRNDLADVDRYNTQVIEDAVKGRFSPEFLNRIDHRVIFRTLSCDHLRQILSLELDAVRRRFAAAMHRDKFIFMVSQSAEDALLAEGVDPKFGARHLKRAIEHRVVHPLANMTRSHQILFGDVIVIDYNDHIFQYRKYDGTAVADMTESDWLLMKATLASSADRSAVLPAHSWAPQGG